jgi:hypothetical protein
MTLPRFTSGRVGNLDFSHLNEAFSKIDDIGRSSGESRKMRPSIGSMIVAQIGVPGLSNQYAWYEVTLGPTGLATVIEGGLSSGSPAPQPNPDLYLLPAVSIDGTVFSVGDIVLLSPARRTDGSSYMTIVKPVGSTVRPYEITGATGISLGRWLYTGQRRKWDAVQTAWVLEGSATTVTMLNGAENAVDSTGNIGVGSTLPGSVPQPIRQRIKDGTIVTPTNSGGVLTFCIPNGYAFQCP